MKEIPEDTKETEENYPIGKLKEFLDEDIENARKELDQCLQDAIRNSINDTLSYEYESIPGFPFSIKFKESSKQLRFNRRCGMTTGVGLEWYRWLILDYYQNDKYIRSYCLGLCREDIDTNTGNIHQDFTKLQMSKCCFLTNERSVNPRPYITEDKDEFYTLHYYAYNCFPTAIRSEIDNDSSPWGYDSFYKTFAENNRITEERAKEIIIDMGPKIMDRTNETNEDEDDKYDPKKVASFFLQLCAYDVEMCYKK